MMARLTGECDDVCADWPILMNQDGDDSTAFATWARAQRIAAVLTQEQLAERAGISVRTIRNIEGGRGPCRPDTWRLVVHALRAATGQVDRQGPVPEQQRVLAAPPPPTRGGPPSTTVRPAQLPADIAGFAGRTDLLEQLDRSLASRAQESSGPILITVLTGTPGVGKTALAVHWAHRIRHRFPDGQLFADLRGFTPGAAPARPLDVLVGFLRTLGVPADDVPTEVEPAAALYRSLLADRGMLVLLDNGVSADQVRPLLPGSGENLVVITSREQLSGLITREGASRFSLGLLSAAEAAQLLEGVLGKARVDREPEAAAMLADLCARLPLALRIAATALHDQPSRSVAEHAAQLYPDPLKELAVRGEPDLAVRAALDLSFLALPEAARRLFRRLGLIPGPDFAVESAAVVGELDMTETQDLVRVLARAHLLEERGGGRYGCHDLLRLYARERAADEESAEQYPAVTGRLYAHYLARAEAAARTLYPNLIRLVGTQPAPAMGFASAGQALAWLDAERASLVAIVLRTAEDGPRETAWRLADALRGYFLRMFVVEWSTCARAALHAAAVEGDSAGQAAARLSLGGLHSRRGNQDQAIDELTQARVAAQRAGWTNGEVGILGGLGNVHLRLGRLVDAAASFREVLALSERSGQREIHATTLLNLGQVSFFLGRLNAAVTYAEQALESAREIGARNMQADAVANLGEACHAVGSYERASRLLAEALAEQRALDHQDSVGCVLCLQAGLHRDRGDEATALVLAQEALDLARAANHRSYEENAVLLLGSVYLQLGEVDVAHGHFEQALGLGTESGGRHTVVGALLGLAETELRRDGPEAARQHLTQARAIALASGFRVAQGRALRLLAQTWLACGQIDVAVRAAGEAVAVQLETGHRLEEAHARLIFTQALDAADQRPAARAEYGAASEIYAELGSPGLDLRSLMTGLA